MPFPTAQAQRSFMEAPMIDLLGFTTLAVATVFALAASTAFQWLVLKATCSLMKPAAAQRLPRPAAVRLIRGTGQLVRAYAPHR
jgi:hypothetical protein